MRLFTTSPHTMSGSIRDTLTEQPEVHIGAPPAEEGEPMDFDLLVQDVLENPEILLDEKYTPEQILEVQKRINPFAGIGGPIPTEDHKRIIACSYINLREDYLRRLSMTSLAGFIFQVLEEWDVPVEQRRWTPKSQLKDDDPASQPSSPADLVTRLEATLAIAKEAAVAAEIATEEKRVALEEDIVLPEKATKAERKAVAVKYAAAEASAAKAAGLLYAATHATHRAGVDAGHRLRATAKEGMKYAQVKAILSRFPLPPPPGQMEMPKALAKNIIDNFLREWLVFDPSIHVRSGHDAATIRAAVESVQIGNTEVKVDTKDPGHLTLDAVRAAAPKPAKEHADAVSMILSKKEYYAATVALLRDGDLVEAALSAIQEPEKFKHYLLPVAATSKARTAAENIPPQDTFHRWAYYTEVNYEELRTITEAIYPERPDLDWALGLWEMFEGTEKEVDEAFNAHCQRYQDEIPSAIKALEFGSWSLLADFKKNRDKIQFYNKNTEVLKRILDRHTEDKRIGAELMRKRVRKTKARNIAEDGPDAKGLKQYKRNISEMGQGLNNQGVENVISVADMRRLEKAKGSLKAAQELELLEEYEKTIKTLGELEGLRELSQDEAEQLKVARDNLERAREMVSVPDDAIQVDIFTSNPKTGEFKKSHIYTEAEAPEHLSKVQDQGASKQGSSHPAVAATQPLAPYAVDHILASQNRSPAEMKQEAVRDANRRK